MAYPASMMPSIQKCAETRQARLNATFPELTFEAKAQLLEDYHPDFNTKVKTPLRLGANTGDLAPQEMARQIEAHSRITPDMVDLSKVDYETDILVIGSGGAGLSAAITAHAQGARVLLATKLRMGDSNTIMAEGGIGAATNPEDSPAIHFVDTLIGGRFTNVRELVQVLVTEAPFIVEWLSELGVNFDRNPDGTLFNHRPGGHSRRRSHSIKDLTGMEIMHVLSDEVRNREIPVLEFCPAVELILDDQGQCAGAVLQNLDNGQLLVVRAKSVIMATGGMGRLHPLGFPTTNHYGATADGIVMGYRAGAKLLYIESVQFHPTGTAWPEQILGLLISEAVRAQGAQVLNVDGEMFAANLETRDALAAAIIRECSTRGKGVQTPTGIVGVWLDTPLIDMIHGPGCFQHRFASIYTRFTSYGINPLEEPILIYPTQHYQNGGMVINTKGESTVPNLYAAGEVSGGVHGQNRLGSNSLLDIFVFGRRSGQNAAEHVKSVKLGKLTLEHLNKWNKDMDAAGITTSVQSPLLLPDYTFEKAVTKVTHMDTAE